MSASGLQQLKGLSWLYLTLVAPFKTHWTVIDIVGREGFVKLTSETVT